MRKIFQRLYGFTLIEALITVGILVVLGGVVMFFVNPVELAKQARDDRRVKEVGMINDAMTVFSEQLPTASTGVASTVYVSLPDTSPTCVNLGLPNLPTGWIYGCVTSANLYNTDGTGWIPVNFKSLTVGTIFAKLPVDPVNTVAGGQYYTYQKGSWVVTAAVESKKYLAQASGDSGSDSGRIEAGSDLKLWQDASGLIARWSFDEGSGTAASDASQNNHSATVTGASWTTGKSGSGLNFTGNASNVVIIPDTSSLDFTKQITMMAWIKPNSISGWQTVMAKNQKDEVYSLRLNSGKPRMDLDEVGSVNSASVGLSAGSWQHLAATWNGSVEKLYINGVEVGTQNRSGTIKTNSDNLQLGRAEDNDDPLNAVLDDVRVYSRGLSANEILTIYNQTR